MAALSSGRNLFYSEFCRTKRDVVPAAPFKEDFHGRNIHQGTVVFYFGRCRGVMVAKFHTPWRSGRPSARRAGATALTGSFGVFGAWPAAGAWASIGAHDITTAAMTNAGVPDDAIDFATGWDMFSLHSSGALAEQPDYVPSLRPPQPGPAASDLGSVLLDFFSLAAGPHPRRELTLMPRLGSPCPRLGMAAGALFFTGGGAPPPPRTDADTFARISMSSLRCGRRRSFLHWRRGPTPAAN